MLTKHFNLLALACTYNKGVPHVNLFEYLKHDTVNSERSGPEKN